MATCKNPKCTATLVDDDYCLWCISAGVPALLAERERLRGAVSLALPAHGGTCDQKDPDPNVLRKKDGPCLRCKVLHVFDAALAPDAAKE